MAIAVGIAGAVAVGLIAVSLGGGMTAAGEYRSLVLAICGSLGALICFRAWALRQGN